MVWNPDGSSRVEEMPVSSFTSFPERMRQQQKQEQEDQHGGVEGELSIDRSSFRVRKA